MMNKLHNMKKFKFQKGQEDKRTKGQKDKRTKGYKKHKHL